MLKKIERLFTTWNENSIKYCHWKSTAHLDATMLGITDIDILVDRAAWSRAEQLAEDEGFIRLDTVPLRTYPGVLDLVSRDESGAWVHIHLHYQLVLGDRWAKAYWLPIEGKILERSWFNKKYNSFVIEPYDELYVFCARMALKHRRPFSRNVVWQEFEHIHNLVSGGNGMKLPGPSSLKVLDDFVNCALCSNNPKPEDLNEHAKKARQALSSIRRYKIIQFYIVSFVRQAYRYWVEYKRRILKIYNSGRRRLPYGGMLVAVLGIDGSGKTTVVERLEKDFAVQINVTRVFLGNGKSGSSWYRRILFFIFGARARGKAHRKMRRSDSKTEKRNVPWYYLLWMCLCLFDKRKNFVSALSGRANGTLVLSDRWPQSQIKNNHDGPRIYGMGKVKRFTAFVAGREHSLLKKAEMIPPDIIFRLIVSPDTAMKRKPEEFTYEEAKRNMESMCQIKWPQSLVVDVDAEQSCQEVHNLIATRIWKHLCGR